MLFFIGPRLRNVGLGTIQLQLAAVDQRSQGVYHSLGIPFMGKTRGRREDHQGGAPMTETPNVHFSAHGLAVDKLVSTSHDCLWIDLL